MDEKIPVGAQALIAGTAVKLAKGGSVYLVKAGLERVHKNLPAGVAIASAGALSLGLLAGLTAYHISESPKFQDFVEKHTGLTPQNHKPTK